MSSDADGAAGGHDEAGGSVATDSRSSSLAVEGLVAGYGGVVALDGVSISAGTAAITAVLEYSIRKETITKNVYNLKKNKK